MRTILVSGIGGPTPRSIARTIKSMPDNIKIIGVDSNNKAIGFFMKNLVDEYYLIPRAGHPDYWITINKLINEKNIDLAFIQPELEVIEWGKYFNENGHFPCKVLIPPLRLAQALIDKANMADILQGTEFIPKTIKLSQINPDFDLVKKTIGFPCWIRATQGSGGLGALKVKDINSLRSWLFINNDINSFTVSEYLPGRHLANQMLYFEGKYIKGASLECVEYVMASISPSKVTGNTSYGRLINDDNILKFCESCIDNICEKLGVLPHCVLSFDLKEDAKGNLKVTEVNIRHMAYTGVLARVGFNLVRDTIDILEKGVDSISKSPYFTFDRRYAFLRDVDIEPIIVEDNFDLDIFR